MQNVLRCWKDASIEPQESQFPCNIQWWWEDNVQNPVTLFRMICCVLTLLWTHFIRILFILGMVSIDNDDGGMFIIHKIHFETVECTHTRDKMTIIKATETPLKTARMIRSEFILLKTSTWPLPLRADDISSEMQKERQNFYIFFAALLKIIVVTESISD